ncbi:DUF3626 domain-containing protein [Lentzea sp. NPDC042327]|uniref:DUF3626 domain-containing protein n=1 Tax=Lentzea sp. NPDC042327 TaxID=3154801 RepID=UPI0033C38FBF
MPRDLRITLNFHPGHGVLAALARDGVYRSQFETGTGNGGLTAHPGGARWQWESRLFGGAYDHAPPAARPKYGALNHRRSEFGGAPRFGSAHLRLTENTLDRSTFCYPDSVFEPVDFGTARHMPLIALTGHRDLLDDYVEAHVHGPVTLADVEAVVLDPSFRGTEVEDAAHALDTRVEWHSGFRMSTTDLDPGFRTPESVELGLRIAVDGVIDPWVLAQADADPQVRKHLWHHLAHTALRGPAPPP